MKTKNLLILIIIITALFTYSACKGRKKVNYYYLSLAKPKQKKKKINYNLNNDLIRTFNFIINSNQKKEDIKKIKQNYLRRMYFKKLLNRGASPNLKNRYGVPLFIIAAYENNLEITKWFLQNGTNINAKDLHGDTALHNAVYKGHKYVVETLLEYGAKTDLINKKGLTPLQVAKQEIKNADKKDNFKNIIQLLKMSDKFGCPLVKAVKKNNITKVKKLLENGAEADQTYRINIVFSTAEQKYIQIKEPILLNAIKKNQEEIVKLLLEYGANPNVSYIESNLTPPAKYINCVLLAIQNNNERILRILLDHGVNKKIAEAGLVYAVSLGNIQLLKDLIKYGCDIQCKYYFGKKIYRNCDGDGKPLLMAIEKGHFGIFKFLLKNGADINSGCVAHSCNWGYNALFFSMLMKRYKITKFILKRKVDVNGSIYPIDGPYRSTVLIEATKKWPEFVEAILKHGAKVNMKDSNNKTALYYAIKLKRTRIIKLLKRYGARE